MNPKSTYRESLPSDPQHIDNIVESLFYRMLSYNMENDIDLSVEAIELEPQNENLRPIIKQKLWHRLHVIGMRP